MVHIFLPHTKCTMNYLTFQLKGRTLISSLVQQCGWNAALSSAVYALHRPNLSLTARPLLHSHTSHSFFRPTSPALYRSASKGKQTPWKTEWARSRPVSASLLNCVCSTLSVLIISTYLCWDSEGTGSHKHYKTLLMTVTHLTQFILLFFLSYSIQHRQPNAIWAGILTHFRHYNHVICSSTSQITFRDLFLSVVRFLLQFYAVLAAQCEATLLLSHGNDLQRNFSKASMVYFSVLCGVSQPISAQPGSVQLMERFRKGPSLQMVAQPLPARGSEGLAAGLEPQPLTG